MHLNIVKKKLNLKCRGKPGNCEEEGDMFKGDMA